jgi:mono/diheme cytochrome c family protein
MILGYLPVTRIGHAVGLGPAMHRGGGWRALRGGLIAGLAGAALGVFALGAPARAVGDPDQAKGIVVEHCVACHAVPGYDHEGLSTVEAPSFQAIADAPQKYTPERLRQFLIQPHWPMTQFRLSARDIEDLLAFIEGLRDR